jgi:tetratricopeptide (TPR) repeat protein
VFIELGRHTYAALPLDTYASLGTELNRTYQFLRARIAWEGNRSRASALTALRAILGTWPNDSDALVYMTRLLLGSPTAANREEGRTLLRRLLDTPGTNTDVSILELSLDDAVERTDWDAANEYLDHILAVDRSYETLRRGVTVNLGRNNRSTAITMAREAASRFPGDSADLLLIGTLTEYGTTAQRSEAAALINRLLAGTQTHSVRSRAMYYRSRLRTNDEDAIRDLGASRLEDPRNLDALLGLIAIYDKRKDSRRVKFFLQQALVLAPENAELNRLKRIYED